MNQQQLPSQRTNQKTHKRRHGWWSHLSASQRGNVVIAIPILCLITMFGAWVWTRQSTMALGQQIDHTRAVIAESDNLLIALIDAETAIRGYDLTRNPDFLEPYRNTITKFLTAQNQLEQLLANQPDQFNQLQKLTQLAQQRLEILDRRLALLQTPSDSDRLETNRLLYQGKNVMDAFRIEIATLQTDQRQILADYSARRDQLRNSTEVVLWATISLSLLSCVAAIYLFNQFDRELLEREQHLRESKTLLRAIVGNVVDGVVTLNEAGKIELFNPAAVKLFGYEPEEVVDRDLSLLLTDSLTQKLNVEKASRWLGSHEIQMGRSWQTVGYRKDETAFPIEISLSELFDNRLIIIIRDITLQQQAKEKLESHATELARINAILAKTNSTLIERNQELDQFAYVASHDLKAPLRAIANLSEWIEEDLQGQIPEESKRLMQLLRGRVHRMEALLNGLLEYSRVGRAELTPEQVDVNDLLTEVIQSLNPPSNFVIKIDPNMPTLLTTRIPLRQVFANLIGNAIKHHDQPEGLIHISVNELQNAYEFAVADDGPGIAPEYHRKIFTIFQTLEARDTKESTGIGLAIVKKIVESQGGAIDVEAEVDGGTTMRFTWLK